MMGRVLALLLDLDFHLFIPNDHKILSLHQRKATKTCLIQIWPLCLQARLLGAESRIQTARVWDFTLKFKTWTQTSTSVSNWPTSTRRITEDESCVYEPETKQQVWSTVSTAQGWISSGVTQERAMCVCGGGSRKLFSIVEHQFIQVLHPNTTALKNTVNKTRSRWSKAFYLKTLDV